MALPTREQLSAARARRAATFTDERRRLPDELCRYADHQAMLQAAEGAWALEESAMDEASPARVAERERRERERTTVFPATPAAATDVLVIGKGLHQHLNSAGAAYDSAADLDGRRYEFSEHRIVSFMGAKIEAAWPRRLPGRVFRTWPRDLLEVYRSHFTRVRAGGRQNTGAGYVDVETDSQGLLRAASEVARGCSYAPLLTTWLGTARAAGDELNGMLARVIEERLRALDGAEAAA